MGFAELWIERVLHCISTVSFLVLINGAPSGEFVPTRGLRKGDPLFPYLFILRAEALSGLLSGAVGMGQLHGVKVTHLTLPISLLFFADDSVIFSKANVEEVNSIRDILHTYEIASGQMVNFGKTTVSFNKGVADKRRVELASLLGVEVVDVHDKYLGLHTVVGRSKRVLTKGIRDKLWSRIQDSLGCLEEIILCEPKEKGSLGFRDFKSFNLALLGNAAVIKEHFLSFECERILSIPISSRLPEDSLCWDLKKGAYSVRPSYWVIFGELDANDAAGALWYTTALPRVKLFFWRACRGTLPILVGLGKRLPGRSTICSLCEVENEFELHCLKECVISRMMWDTCGFLMDVGGCFRTFGDMAAAARNKWIFEGEACNLQHSLEYATKLMSELKGEEGELVSIGGRAKQKWCPPG
ncbi:uncharacterized protein LOC110687116 [Chenopodium quinoa]|uniref:uncharacterized protein LOC110687116 n=1 Tax=Chenopodium quinoa TaxID=63459 RepID=UPI000B772F35|nr:uncharacterized protein LOC110687116 [Chenopodium quinoa]